MRLGENTRPHVMTLQVGIGGLGTGAPIHFHSGVCDTVWGAQKQLLLVKILSKHHPNL